MASLKEATLILATQICKENGGKYPTKKTSYLFGNSKDISDWLEPIPEEQRTDLYNKWIENKHVSPDRERYSVLISNLPDTITEAELLIICGTIGVPRDIYRPCDYYTKEKKNIAFIDFERAIDMLIAIKELSGCSLRGMTLCVSVSVNAFKSNPSGTKKSYILSKYEQSTPTQQT